MYVYTSVLPSSPTNSYVKLHITVHVSTPSMSFLGCILYYFTVIKFWFVNNPLTFPLSLPPLYTLSFSLPLPPSSRPSPSPPLPSPSPSFFPPSLSPPFSQVPSALNSIVLFDTLSLDFEISEAIIINYGGQMRSLTSQATPKEGVAWQLNQRLAPPEKIRVKV